ncbi:MAG: hypothetical protein ABII96_04705, partial [Candidatus Zixiibacteriota bacterium]
EELQEKINKVETAMCERRIVEIRKWFDEMDRLASVGQGDIKGKLLWLNDQLRQMSSLGEAAPYRIYEIAKEHGLEAAIDLFRKNFDNLLINSMLREDGYSPNKIETMELDDKIKRLKLPEELYKKANFVRIFCNMANHKFGITYKWSDLWVLAKFSLDLLKWYEKSKKEKK